MLDRLQAAGDLAPLLFYLLIMVFWAVAKAKTNARKGRGDDAAPEDGEPQPPARPDRPVLDPTLEEFLETITGQKRERREPPQAQRPEAGPDVVPRPAPGRPVARRPARAAGPRGRRPIPAPPVVPAQAPVPAPPAAGKPPPRSRSKPARATIAGEIGEPAQFSYDIPEARGDVIEASEIGKHGEVSGRPILGSMSALAGLDAMRMPLPSMRLPHQPSREVKHRNLADLKGASDIRRALIHRIVLGPPPSINPTPLELHPNVNK